MPDQRGTQSLRAGLRLGPYEIVAPIGAGGMGEVYRAKDTRLDRTVAIKVLPSAVAGNAHLRQRLEREARAVSSLSHPHICVLHDVGFEDGIDFLVMEYLEGETLAARLGKGPLPVRQALEFAIQISSALAQAHLRGVYHRDLKPANIMLTRSGCKLLDFGLAKLRVSREGGAEASELATVTASEGLTEAGAILGTFRYMAPEQLEGKEIDGRADIFAFGAVLYEMLTGQKAFGGTSQASITTAIMATEPAPIPSLPALDRLVKKCLVKDRDERWQSAQDLTSQLSWIAEDGSQPGNAADLSTGVGKRWLAMLLVAAAAVPGVLYLRQTTPEQRVTKFTMSPPENTTFTFLAVSPDGRRVAFTAMDAARKSQLWVRGLNSVEAQRLAGTEGAANPFWSPDSRQIGFFAGNTLKKIDASGGPAQVVTAAQDNLSGGDWNRQGIIILGLGPLGRLSQVSDTGGEAKPVTDLDQAREETAHRWPRFLPDGRHFLYHNFSPQPGEGAVYAGSLDSKERVRLFASDTSATYVGPASGVGHLLFVRGQTLMAQPFDPERLQTSGEAVAVAEPVGGTLQRSGFSVSGGGVLVYDSIGHNSELRWFDRGGKAQETVGPADMYVNLDLAPDGHRVAADFRGDIWLFDLARNVNSRLTSNPALDTVPHWSPDGKRIVFTSTRNGSWNLYQKLSSGEGEEEELIAKSAGVRLSCDWSPDGRFLLYAQTLDSKTGWDLWALPMEGERKPLAVLRTQFDEHWGRFSPDGKWIAYVSNETGRSEVFVRAFLAERPESAVKWPISNGGGELPRWRADGKELFYLGPDRQMMAVAVRLPAESSAAVETGVPQALFTTHAQVGNFSSYAVAADGQRFLINQLTPQAGLGLATVTVNWNAKSGK